MITYEAVEVSCRYAAWLNDSWLGFPATVALSQKERILPDTSQKIHGLIPLTSYSWWNYGANSLEDKSQLLQWYMPELHILAVCCWKWSSISPFLFNPYYRSFHAGNIQQYTGLFLWSWHQGHSLCQVLNPFSVQNLCLTRIAVIVQNITEVGIFTLGVKHTQVWWIFSPRGTLFRQWRSFFSS